MRIKLLVLALTTFFISCNSTETIADKDIDVNLSKTIKAKNDSLLQAMTYSDYKALKALGSPDFNKYMHAKLKSNNIIWAFRKGFLTTGNYTVLHQYHNKHGKAIGNANIENEEENYSFKYTHKQKETYVSMLKASANGNEDYLITLMYGLIDGQWKLNDIDVGLYGVYNKNAQQYAALAEKAKKEDYVIDAYLYYDSADDLMDPCNKMLKYNNEDEIIFDAKSAMEKVNKKYAFPNKLEQVASQPEIYGIERVMNAKGIYPLINYKSQVPVTDTVTLKKEYEKIKEQMPKAYPGLNFKDKDFIYYRAYNDDGHNFTFEDVRKK